LIFISFRPLFSFSTTDNIACNGTGYDHTNTKEEEVYQDLCALHRTSRSQVELRTEPPPVRAWDTHSGGPVTLARVLTALIPDSPPSSFFFALHLDRLVDELRAARLRHPGANWHGVQLPGCAHSAED